MPHSTRTLHTADGQTISAYVAEPVGKPKGGIVTVQGIFGANAHIWLRGCSGGKKSSVPAARGERVARHLDDPEHEAMGQRQQRPEHQRQRRAARGAKRADTR
ncbi:MAG: hypothetical protein ACUVVU_08130 [Tepidimonas sp.]|uniref:hypothetical protein n=1 Tax=Tepidimonas sp. TaxID=2002775 RepID=UPI004054C1DD